MPETRLDDLEALLDAFESQCARGSVPNEDLEEFLPAANDPRRPAHLVELLRVALERRWAAGSKHPIDQFRPTFPTLFADATLLSPLAFEEYRLRIQDGQLVDVAEYSRRFGVDVRNWPSLRPQTQATDASASSDRASPAQEALDRSQRWRTFSRHSPETARRWQAAAEQQPTVGQTFDDFELVAELGRGAFARVFLARQMSLGGRHVALKLTVGPTGEPVQLARLQHSHIVPIYSVHRHGDLTAVCMPYLGSSTLADVVRSAWPRSPDSIAAPRGGQAIVSTVVARQAELPTWRQDHSFEYTAELPPGDSPRLSELGQSSFVDAVTRIMTQVAEGLAHAHDRGILHRDMKPANILLDHDGQPLILDFNLAAATSNEAVGQALVGGTLPYMSPEQLGAVLDGRPTDRRADIFSVGVVLYELLVGRLPHSLPRGSLESLVAHLRRCWSEGAASPRAANPAISRGLDAIVRKCLAPSPDHRYQTADQLAEDLRRQLTHRPLRYARESWSVELLKKWNKRHPRLSSATSVAATALVFLSLVSAAWFARGQQLARANAEEQFRAFEEQLPGVRVMLAPGVSKAEPVIAAEGTAAARRLLETYGVPDDLAWRSRDLVRMLSNEHRHQLVRYSTELQELAADAQPGAVDSLDVELDSDAGALRTSWKLVTERRFADAIERLEEHLKQDPRDAAAWLAIGYCHVSERDLEKAEIAYTMCHSLAPDLYVPHYFRGIVRLEKKEFTAARDDFSDTLGLRPELAEAAFHRALASQGMGDHRRAIDDFDLALQLGMNHTRIYFLRSRSHAALGDQDAALRDRTEGLRLEPTDDQSWVARGLERLPTDPNGAEHDFRAALQANPASLPALANLAHVLSERLQRPAEALECLGEWIEKYPQDAVGWGSRGVLRARQGVIEESVRDGDAALARSQVPFVLYQTGCIHALLTPQRAESRDVARRLVARALRDQPGLFTEMQNDPDLTNLREDAGFQQLLAAAKTLVESAGR